MRRLETDLEKFQVFHDGFRNEYFISITTYDGTGYNHRVDWYTLQRIKKAMCKLDTKIPDIIYLCKVSYDPQEHVSTISTTSTTPEPDWKNE